MSIIFIVYARSETYTGNSQDDNSWRVAHWSTDNNHYDNHQYCHQENEVAQYYPMSGIEE